MGPRGGRGPRVSPGEVVAVLRFSGLVVVVGEVVVLCVENHEDEGLRNSANFAQFSRGRLSRGLSPGRFGGILQIIRLVGWAHRLGRAARVRLMNCQRTRERRSKGERL